MNLFFNHIHKTQSKALCKFLLILFSLFAAPVFVMAQGSIVIDTLKMYSKILKMDRNYAVYLPPGYYSSARTYPVLYLLHGGGVDHRGWTQQGELQTIADSVIQNQSATAMIIVMPDAFTQRRGYFQNKENWLYEDFFIKEFMPLIESTYRVRATQHFRAICGFSIGGKAAISYSLHHPELFAAACPLSAATGLGLTSDTTKGPPRPTKPGKPDRYSRENDLLALVRELPDSLKNKTRWYLDCGDDDFLYEGNVQLRAAMQQRGIKTEFRVRDGGHTWEYWRSGLPAALQFISTGFRDY